MEDEKTKRDDVNPPTHEIPDTPDAKLDPIDRRLGAIEGGVKLVLRRLPKPRA